MSHFAKFELDPRTLNFLFDIASWQIRFLEKIRLGISSGLPELRWSPFDFFYVLILKVLFPSYLTQSKVSILSSVAARTDRVRVRLALISFSALSAADRADRADRADKERTNTLFASFREFVRLIALCPLSPLCPPCPI